jgi:hypothetical protein
LDQPARVSNDTDREGPRRDRTGNRVLPSPGSGAYLSQPSRGPMTDLATNVLYYGDNLDILRRYLPDAAVDLVDLDPPFNSNRDYNVIFRDESGKTRDAQLLAFGDTH